MTNWGSSGETVYRRTYSRTKTDGSKEDWPDTVNRVIAGNVGLVPGGLVDDAEISDLTKLMTDFSVIPAGRHLWASGVKGRQYLFNCWVSGWGESISDHFTFSFLRLMEGGGVGSCYDSANTERYGPPLHPVAVHVVCDPSHPDYLEMASQGLLSPTYSPDYRGAYTEVEDSREGWSEALSELLEAAWYVPDAAVLVFDVSRVRWKGSRLKSFGGHASGPGPLAKMLSDVADVINELFTISKGDPGWIIKGLPLDPISAMEIDHAIAQCVVAGGNRRSARMSILHWSDPWIFDFIECKADTGKHWTTNISVAIDDRFLEAISDDLMPSHNLAKRVLDAIASGMLTNGEPGIWNQSLSQKGEAGKVVATNPCGEIALEEWEACNLSHLRLDAFVENGYFDYELADRAVRLMTRFLIRATFGDINDPKSRAIMDRNRRIGMGLLGVQAAFAKMGIRYSDAAGRFTCSDILEYLAESVRDEARTYAFKLRIPEPVKVTCVAPTGTIAKLPGTTEGIHPIYSRYFLRRIRFSTIDPDEIEQLEEYRELGYNVEPCIYADNTMVVTIPTKERLVSEVEALGFDPDIVESADELTLKQMLDFQEMVQGSWADNAVSFTANIPVGSMDVETLVETLSGYLPDIKGTTIMPDGTRAQAPYERISQADYDLYKLALRSLGDSIDEECTSGACPVR